jgi:hypothetical protein
MRNGREIWIGCSILIAIVAIISLPRIVFSAESVRGFQTVPSPLPKPAPPGYAPSPVFTPPMGSPKSAPPAFAPSPVFPPSPWPLLPKKRKGLGPTGGQ